MKFIIGVICMFIGTFGAAYTMHAFREEWYGFPILLTCAAIWYVGLATFLTGERE